MEKKPFTFVKTDEKSFSRIASFYHSNNYGLVEESHLKWKYLENPYGKGHFFLVLDPQENIQGTLGYIPRYIYGEKNGPKKVLDAVDLYFTPETRGKKIFPEFKRFAMNHLGDSLIAFPNKRSEKVTIDIGWTHVAPINTWFFPMFSKKCQRKKIPKFLLVFCRLIEFLYDFAYLGKKSNQVTLNEVSRFNSDFSQMTAKRRPGHSFDYLNWRYADNPTQKFKLLEYRTKGQTIGYCVLKTEEKSVVIYDFFAESHQRQCFRKIIDYCKDDDFEKLILKSIGINFWKYGFIKFSSEISLISYNLPGDKWMLMIGDSDW
jgi:hypothetical protein